jgi:hypothetical protein
MVTVAVVYISSGRDTHDELHQLLTLTNLTNAAIVRGYLLTAWRRFRIIIVIGLGLLPFLLLYELGAYRIVASKDAEFWFDACTLIASACRARYLLALQLINEVTVDQLALTINQLGLNLFAAVIGVAGALRKRNTPSPMDMLLLWLIIFVLTTITVWALATLSSPFFDPRLVGLLFVFWGISPYLVIVAIIKLMEGFVRRAT